jgi:L-threonate 2-dehydrogenase
MADAFADVSPVGVIGAGAMGMGVVHSLRRHAIATWVRDIRDGAAREAGALGAKIAATPADLLRGCPVAIVLVVDADQVEDVLFGVDGAAHAGTQERIVVLSSTVAPDYVVGLAPRLAAHGITLVDAPISGGPLRAHEGTLTIMTGGPEDALAHCAPIFACLASKIFKVGCAGDGAKCKIANNLLAAVNLAAGAEALALAIKAGLDPQQFIEIVNASSGASWIFNDRMPRALAHDFAPRAAARVLTKDVGIAAAFAAQLGVDAPFAQAALRVFRETVDAGYGEDDDAIVALRALERAGIKR